MDIVRLRDLKRTGRRDRFLQSDALMSEMLTYLLANYIKDRQQRGARFAFIPAGGHCTILPGYSLYLNRTTRK